MATDHLIPPRVSTRYEVHEWRNACAVLKEAHLQEWRDIMYVLGRFRLRRSDILRRGKGNKSAVTEAIDSGFYARKWQERSFDTKITVGTQETPVPTHKVDCFKNEVGIEVDWNSKDSVFDRDLNNFRLLFDLRVLSVGVLVTRCDELQGLLNGLGKGKSYGPSTTHMSKLLPKLLGGGGGGCPILVLGIPRALYVAT